MKMDSSTSVWLLLLMLWFCQVWAVCRTSQMMTKSRATLRVRMRRARETRAKTTTETLEDCWRTSSSDALPLVSNQLTHTHTHTHTHPVNGSLSRTTWVSRYQKGKTNLDFTEARDSEWQWHQLGHMQVCTSLWTDNHASTPPLSFFTGRMPFLPPNQQRQNTDC